MNTRVLNISMVTLIYSVAYLMSCSAENDLEDIKNTHIQCLEFKKRYDEVKPTVITELIANKIATCQKHGVQVGDHVP